VSWTEGNLPVIRPKKKYAWGRGDRRVLFLFRCDTGGGSGWFSNHVN
jgi:hypothetical protein